GNESNSESIDTESDIDLDNYEYYDNHNRDIDFLIVDYLDLNNSLFNYKGSNENEIDISFNNEDRNCNENNNDDEIQSSEEINDGGEKISNINRMGVENNIDFIWKVPKQAFQPILINASSLLSQKILEASISTLPVDYISQSISNTISSKLGYII
ncbi:9470_t:CDS:2, partial [Entrophospora sp. SA101]